MNPSKKLSTEDMEKPQYNSFDCFFVFSLTLIFMILRKTYLIGHAVMAFIHP